MWFPLDPSKWFIAWTGAERRQIQILTMLCLRAWQEGGITPDWKKLSLLTGESPDTIETIWPYFELVSEERDGVWLPSQCWAGLDGYQSKRVAGAIGAEKRWKKGGLRQTKDLQDASAIAESEKTPHKHSTAMQINRSKSKTGEVSPETPLSVLRFVNSPKNMSRNDQTDVPANGALPEKTKGGKWTETVEEIFNCWKSTLNHPKSILDEKRRKLIIARLKEGFTVEQLKQAIEGIARSEWHMGQNDRHTRYDGLELIFRDAGKVEKFMALAGEAASVADDSDPTGLRRLARQLAAPYGLL